VKLGEASGEAEREARVQAFERPGLKLSPAPAPHLGFDLVEESGADAAARVPRVNQKVQAEAAPFEAIGRGVATGALLSVDELRTILVETLDLLAGLPQEAREVQPPERLVAHAEHVISV
jgi:hypothetical protein